MNLQFQTPLVTRIAHLVYHLEQSQFNNANDIQKSRAFALLARTLMDRANLIDECEFIVADNETELSSLKLIPLNVIYSYPNGFHEVNTFVSTISKEQAVGQRELSPTEFASELKRISSLVINEYTCKLEELDAPKLGDHIAEVYIKLQKELEDLEIIRALNFVKHCSEKVAVWNRIADSVKSVIENLNTESVKNGTIRIESTDITLNRFIKKYSIHTVDTLNVISFEFDFPNSQLKSGRFLATLPDTICQVFKQNLNIQSSLTEGRSKYLKIEQNEAIVNYLFGKGFHISEKFLNKVGIKPQGIQMKYLARYKSLEPLLGELKKFNDNISYQTPIHNVNLISDLFKQFKEYPDERKLDFASKFVLSGINIDNLVKDSYPSENPKFIDIAEIVLAKIKETNVYSYILITQLTHSLDKTIEDFIYIGNEISEDKAIEHAMSL